MVVELGPYPLCGRCQETNGGLVATRHRQVHLRVADQEACVDQGLVDVVAAVWTVASTRSCCQDDDGRAYVVPTADTVDAAEAALRGLGLDVERTDGGVLRFALPPPPPAEPLGHVPVDRGDFLDVLEAARRLVDGAAEQLSTHTAGIGHPRMSEARGQVAAAQSWLTAGMLRRVSIFRMSRGTLRPLGVLFQLALLSAGCWVGAALARLVSDGSTAWSLVGGIAGLVAVMWPVVRLTNLADDRTSRRRAARILRAYDAGAFVPPALPGVLVAADRRLDDVRTTIDAARTILGVVALRLPPQAFEVRALTEADLALCQASDAIRIWLEAPRG
ncbi:hypothetical protein [Asanoa sp. NPDC050611]|uniref:hypothetical protein n=1 Tax=Asanoa sp. NPDC050611 TaxID=3157098 RepID=UPI0033DA43D9